MEINSQMAKMIYARVGHLPCGHNPQDADARESISDAGGKMHRFLEIYCIVCGDIFLVQDLTATRGMPLELVVAGPNKNGAIAKEGWAPHSTSKHNDEEFEPDDSDEPPIEEDE